MSNTFWSQNHINFAALEDEYNFNANQQQQHQHLLPYSPQQQEPYGYQPHLASSSLQNAFGQNQSHQQSLQQSSSFGGSQSSLSTYFSSQQTPSLSSALPTAGGSNSYRPLATSLNFDPEPNHHEQLGPRFASPPVLPTLETNFSSPTSILPARLPKRARDESKPDDHPVEQPALDQKDGKAKLQRACARCKSLKVRCEAKTETDPCKRCFNGGHECVIPGRKIRKTPPKREHLLNQIQAQAKQIETLMRELEKVSSQRDQKPPDHLESKLNDFQLSSDTVLDGSESLENGIAGCSANGDPQPNEVLANWVAKAKESFQEFGTFLAIGGAALPKSYLMEIDEDEDDSSGDEYVDAEEPEDDDDASYKITIESRTGDPPIIDGRRIQHKSSASSMDTNATANTSGQRRKNAESSKPANLPVEASPFGLFGNMMLRSPKSRDNSVEPEEGYKGPGIANEDFFSATPAPNALGRRLEITQHQWPAILTRNIITPQEAEKLFKIYFDNINLSVSLLDPVLYTAHRTIFRSPFLFTVICAIASRFYTERPDVYTQLMRHAQLSAGTALISGNKNVEMCQAFILLSLYPVPSRKWEDQRGWLYLGLAIRTATDLNLHLLVTAKERNENHAREMLNRTRVWLNCFNLDRSTGSQYGKPPIISPYDYTANHAENWWCSSAYNLENFDIHISAYNAELKVMAGFIAQVYSDRHHPMGLNKSVDFEAIAIATDDEIKALGEMWMRKIHEKTDMNNPQNAFRTGLLRLAYSYSRLIALSYGIQYAFGKVEGKDEGPFLERCLKAAYDVVNVVVKDICKPSQVHYWRHGPEAQSVFTTFAAAFLVKTLQPKFSSYLSQEKRTEIIRLVQSVIDLLGSPKVAIDDRHGPKIYSRFLEKLLNKAILPTSPNSTTTSLPPRNRFRRPKTTSNTQRPSSSPDSTFAMENSSQIVFNHPSPATSNSLSPPPTSDALSFDQFAPVGGLDPFAQNAVSQVDGMATDGDLFQPPLPFDPEILQSFQSLTDPNEWSDVSFPSQFLGGNWISQFQQNMEMNHNTNGLYNQNLYMTS